MRGLLQQSRSLNVSFGVKLLDAVQQSHAGRSGKAALSTQIGHTLLSKTVTAAGEGEDKERPFMSQTRKPFPSYGATEVVSHGQHRNHVSLEVF